MMLSAWTDLSGPLAKYILPAVATLIPAGITAVLKWTQEHSRNRRSVALTERISVLAKSIHELPDLPPLSATSTVTPQSALAVELESALHELTVLQTRVRRGFGGVSTITAKLRAGMLLYRPKGWAAITLHLAFFAYLLVFFFALSAGIAGSSTADVEHAKTTSDLFWNVFGFMVVFGIAGIPPLILRHFAAKIHRRQCLEAQAAKPPVVEVSPLDAVGAASSHAI